MLFFSFSKINEKKEDETIDIEELSNNSKGSDDVSISSTFSTTNHPLEFLRTAHKHLGR